MPKERKIDKEELKQRRVEVGAVLEGRLLQAEIARRVGLSRESVRRWSAMSGPGNCTSTASAAAQVGIVIASI